VAVTIEIARGSFLKRGSSGQLDFISPLPCPYNYGSVTNMLGLDGDLLDAIVLGPRLKRGTRVNTFAVGAVGLTDRDMYDDKLICSIEPVSKQQREDIVRFFHLYARSKRLLNLFRGQPGTTECEGWGSARDALARARPVSGGWSAPVVRF
jgi:inorganic pyrophosphatase